MPQLDVSLENLNTSVNIDHFDIRDNVLGALIAQQIQVQGGSLYPFKAEDDGTGNGDITIINTENMVSVHFQFVKQNDVSEIVVEYLATN